VVWVKNRTVHTALPGVQNSLGGLDRAQARCEHAACSGDAWGVCMSHRQSSRLRVSWGRGASCASTLGLMRSPRLGECTTQSSAARAHHAARGLHGACALAGSGRLGERGKDAGGESRDHPAASPSATASSHSGVRSFSRLGDLLCHRQRRVRRAQRAWHKGQRRLESQLQPQAPQQQAQVAPARAPQPSPSPAPVSGESTGHQTCSTTTQHDGVALAAATHL